MGHETLALDSRTYTQPSWRVSLVGVLALLWLTACGAGAQTNNAAAVITLLADSSTAPVETIGVQLQTPDQTPITDATVKVEGNMNHAGMVPVLTEPVRDEADGTADGIYSLPFQFTMLGDWIITVEATLADGTVATRDIEVGVTETGMTIQE